MRTIMRRTGLFLCKAPCVEGRYLDVERLAGDFVDSVEVVDVLENMHLPDSRGLIVERVRDRRLEAVILAGCSPEHYEGTLGGGEIVGELELAGINPNLVGFVNLREQCSLPHLHEPAAQVLAKAKALTQVALADVQAREPSVLVEVPPRKSVLVVGDGIAAVSAAYRLLKAGFRVTVAGLSESWDWPAEADEHLRMAASAVARDPRCSLHFSTEARRVTGWAGDYRVSLSTGDQQRVEHCAGIIVAVDRKFQSYVQLWPFLRVDTDTDGAPRARNRHTLSVRSTTEGIALVGAGDGGADVVDRIRQQSMDGAVAALEMLELLNRPAIVHEVKVSHVDAEHCGMCRTCTKVCAFSACSIDELAGTSKVDEYLCKGCGNCVVACPAGARDLVAEPTENLTRAIEILANCATNGAPKVLAMLCSGCAYRAADQAGIQGFGYPVSIMPLKVTCGGRVDMQHVLEAFQFGFSGVILGCCRTGHCHNIVGHLYLDRRVVLFREVLRSRGIDPDRLQIMDISPHEGEQCATTFSDFVGSLRDAMTGGR